MEDQSNRCIFTIRWTDLDAIGHLRGSAYIDLATDARIQLLGRAGITQQKLDELGVGPVILRQEVRYFRELNAGDTVTVTSLLAGISSDHSRWIIHHDFYAEDGEQVARLKVEGTWLDLTARQAVPPPGELVDVMAIFPRTNNFEELRSFTKKHTGPAK